MKQVPMRILWTRKRELLHYAFPTNAISATAFYLIIGGTITLLIAWLLALYSRRFDPAITEKYFYVENGSIWNIDIMFLPGEVRIKSLRGAYVIDDQQVDFALRVEDPELVSLDASLAPQESEKEAFVFEISGRIVCTASNRKRLYYKWIYPSASLPSDSSLARDGIFIDKAYGLPLLCLRSREHLAAISGSNLLDSKVYDGYVLKRGLHGIASIVLPYRPIVTGFMANTIIYGIVLFVIVVGIKTIKAARCMRRGLCVSCRYQLDGIVSPRCPECGMNIHGN